MITLEAVREPEHSNSHWYYPRSMSKHILSSSAAEEATSPTHSRLVRPALARFYCEYRIHTDDKAIIDEFRGLCICFLMYMDDACTAG
jgi:hypothetical protein